MSQGIVTLSTNLAEMRERALRAVMEATHSSVGSHYQLFRDGERVDARFQTTFSVDLASTRRMFNRQYTRLVPAIAKSYRRTWGREQFLNATQCYGTGEEYERHPIVQAVFHGMGFVDQLRIAVFDGDRHVAWFGVLRRRGEGRYTRSEAQAANALSEQVTTLLLTADRMLRANLPEEGCDLLATPDGRVEYASPLGRAWLRSAGGLALVRRLVTSHDRRGRSDGVGLAAGVFARLARLESSGQVRYLVQLRPATAYKLLGPRLTPAQRDVALLLSRGCTVSEAARHLDRSVETVRTHLREIYQRLGIASRAELARAVAEDGGGESG